MDSRELKQEAEFRVGTEVLSEIQELYTKTVQQPWDYVVFVVRRSYLLALMMEKITGVQMGKEARFLTDAAFMLQCREIAEQYRRNRRFPSVLLCDDILIHGRNINHFIEVVEKCLIDYLPEVNKEEIQQALVKSLKIRVYVRADAPLLLLGRYELNLEYVRREEPVFWRKLSNDISSLIVYSGMANASYVYSDWITKEQFQKLDLSSWKFTSYQGVKQYARVQFLTEHNHVKAVYTLRLISNRFGGYRLIPFVFLPNLDEKESHKLLGYIHNKMAQKGFLTEETEQFCEWEGQRGKRSFNELVTLILSSAVLREYEEKCNVRVDERERGEEFKKLVRNYRQSDWNKTEDFLKRIVSTKIFSVKEFNQILLNTISKERKVFSVFEGDGKEVSTDGQMEIVDALEKYFYGQGRREEIEAYELSGKPYFESSRRSRRIARGCCFLLNEVADNYSVEQAKYMIAYFLQMMDAGVLSLSSYAPSQIRVVGFAQFAKAGEQSLLLDILKHFEYIPVLAKIQSYCEYERLYIWQVLREYSFSPVCDLSRDVTEELEDLVQSLEEMGQKPADWNKNYLFKIDDDYHIRRSGGKDITEYIQKQDSHVRHFMDYLKENRLAY